MGDFEKWRVCSPEEYREKVKSPADPAEMVWGKPYLWMVSFDGGHGQQPGRIQSVQPAGHRIYRIGFVTFDGSWHEEERFLEDMRDDSNEQQGYFKDGLFKLRKDRDSGLFFPVPGGFQVRVDEGYFVEDEEPASESTGNNVPDEGIARTPKEMEKLLGNPYQPREPAGV